MSQEMKAIRSIAGRKGERQRSRRGWLAVTGLLLLSALPVLGGALRLRDVGAVAESGLPWASSVAIVAHILATSVFCLLGAFQFSPALRIRRGWHRTAGRALIPAGLVAGLSAVWLAVFFGGPPDERALAMVRLVFAVAMTSFLMLGAIAIKRRDFTAHGAWMTRAFAIAVSGGTQALVVVLWALPFGEVDVDGETWLVAAGFVINSVVAECLIRRRSGRRQWAMSHQWPALGPAHPVDGFIEPMLWGTATYTVIRVPDGLVEAARSLGTRRVAGELEGVGVNLALTRAPVFTGTFVWAGASLLRRLRLEVGDPVTGHLAPVDPEEVPVPPDLADALAGAGLRSAWDALPPATRRRRLVPVDAAATPTTRARRIHAILDGL